MENTNIKIVSFTALIALFSVGAFVFMQKPPASKVAQVHRSSPDIGTIAMEAENSVHSPVHSEETVKIFTTEYRDLEVHELKAAIARNEGGAALQLAIRTWHTDQVEAKRLFLEAAALGNDPLPLGKWISMAIMSLPPIKGQEVTYIATKMQQDINPEIIDPSYLFNVVQLLCEYSMCERNSLKKEVAQRLDQAVFENIETLKNMRARSGVVGEITF